MYKEYAAISCFQSLDDMPLKNPFIKYYGEKKMKKYFLKHFPITVEEMTCQDVKGQVIKIPIITSIKSFLNEDYIRMVITRLNNFLSQLDINVVIISEELKPYIAEFDLLVSRGNLLGLIYMEKILKEVRGKLNKREKDIRYILIDGESGNTEYILEIITENTNDVTLITDSPQRYEEKIQEIYENNGLAIQMKNKKLGEEMDGDIIINCSVQYDKLFYGYREDSIIIDFVSSCDKINNIRLKRSKLKIVDTFTVSIGNQIVDADLLFGILLNQNRILRSMVTYGYRKSMKKPIELIKSTYGCRFRLAYS